jgi:hypothetical protein
MKETANNQWFIRVRSLSFRTIGPGYTYTLPVPADSKGQDNHQLLCSSYSFRMAAMAAMAAICILLTLVAMMLVSSNKKDSKYLKKDFYK